MRDDEYIRMAIDESLAAINMGGYPVGAVLVRGGDIIASGISNGKQLSDPTSHAEVVAIRAACQRLRTRRLKDATLYVSCEPCLMCYAASVWASVPRVVFACGRSRLSRQFVEGDHDLMAINAKSWRPAQIVHLAELEERSLEIIRIWESSL